MTPTGSVRAAGMDAGLLLAHSMLVHDELRSGRLVQPLDVVRLIEHAYFFVWPTRKWTLPAVAAFRDWLVSETARDASAL